jgi:hypothetical protein
MKWRGDILAAAAARTDMLMVYDSRVEVIATEKIVKE